MAQVSITISGRPYRMACGEGEEEHLRQLGRRLDAKIAELKGSFGEIGDQRITIMAALTMADQLSEAERRIAALEAQIPALQQAQVAAAASADAAGEAVGVALDDIATRIDRVAQNLLAPRP